MKDQVIIFDTTLRDGEQSPGDFEAVERIAGKILNTQVTALVRASKEDIDKANG
jgi:isopropylmalate/homocitrate/citramalate synthase